MPSTLLPIHTSTTLMLFELSACLSFSSFSSKFNEHKFYRIFRHENEIPNFPSFPPFVAFCVFLFFCFLIDCSLFSLFPFFFSFFFFPLSFHSVLCHPIGTLTDGRHSRTEIQWAVEDQKHAPCLRVLILVCTQLLTPFLKPFSICETNTQPHTQKNTMGL